MNPPLPNFTLIAEGLSVAPVLAELAALPDYCWLRINSDDSRYVGLLGGGGERQYESELPDTWRLIDRILATLAAEHGDCGRLCHARVGLMPPGEGLPPHSDGIDGITQRRYQIALQSQDGVELIVGGEAKCPRPGEVWRIDASRTHSVCNRSEADRITILLDTRD